MNNENQKMSARPFASDPLNEALYGKMAEIAKWTAPCTFARTEKAPLDSKSVFALLSDLQDYIDDEVYGTAYPGQVVAVTYDGENNGAYILVSKNVGVETDEDDPNNPGHKIIDYVQKLEPIRLGTSQEINSASASAVMNWLGADGNAIEE